MSTAQKQADVRPSGADPLPEEIARRAYSLWEEQGIPEGCADETWYQALTEKELRNPNAIPDSPRGPGRETGDRAKESNAA